MNHPFAERTLKQLIAEGIIAKTDKVLVVCGYNEDRDLFARLGFTDVLITDYRDEYAKRDYTPFRGERQNAQALTYPDKSFDFAFVSEGLHHCASPHRAVTEMYRVARKAIVCIEARDNLMMRAAIALNFTNQYETDIISLGWGPGAGVDVSDVPNQIYRWTEREFEKCIQSFDPTGPHRFFYFYDLRLPTLRLKIEKRRALYALMMMAMPFLVVGRILLPKQINNAFAFIATRPETTWPWLKRGECGTLLLNRDYRR